MADKTERAIMGPSISSAYGIGLKKTKRVTFMWKLVAIAVLLMVLVLAIVVMSGCPRLKTGEEIEAEKLEELGPGPIPPPPPPPPGREGAPDSAVEEDTTAPQPPPETAPEPEKPAGG